MWTLSIADLLAEPNRRQAIQAQPRPEPADERHYVRGPGDGRLQRQKSFDRLGRAADSNDRRRK